MTILYFDSKFNNIIIISIISGVLFFCCYNCFVMYRVVPGPHILP